MPNEIDRIKELEARLALYEQNGAAKMYYALQRKMNEMGDMLNKHNLSNLELDDGKNKAFERLKVIWSDAESIAKGVDALGKLAKVTGNEKEDIEKKPFIERLPDVRN